MSYTRTITENGNSVSQSGGQSFNQQLDALEEQIGEGGGAPAGTGFVKVTDGEYDTPGPLSASDIPNLPASKITSGQFDTARLPTKVGFLAVATAQNAGTASPKLSWATAIYNTCATYSSGDITLTVAGDYLIEIVLYANPGAAIGLPLLRLNGSLLTPGGSGEATSLLYYPQLRTFVPGLLVGDVISVGGYASATTALNTSETFIRLTRIN